MNFTIVLELQSTIPLYVNRAHIAELLVQDCDASEVSVTAVRVICGTLSSLVTVHGAAKSLGGGTFAA